MKNLNNFDNTDMNKKKTFTNPDGGILLSIIVPVYNVEKYLPDCLESLLNQGIDEDSYEILCIDDGSTDDCYDILNKYANKHKQIKVFHQENKGVSAARNVGLDNASGKYIAFVDSDDFVICGAYGELCKKAEEMGAEYIRFSVEKVEEKAHPDGENVSDIRIINNQTGNPLSSSTIYNTLTKNDVIRNYNIRFNENQRYGEDTLVTFFVTLFVDPKNQYFCYEELYKYRQRPGSAIRLSSRPSYQIADMFIMIDAFENVLKSQIDLTDWQKNNIKDRMYLCSSSALFSSMRVSKERAVETKEKLESMELYPYPFMLYIIKRKINLGNLIMLILKWPVVFQILNKSGLLVKKQ